MTVPIERSYAIENTREFLRDLLDPKKTPRIPKEVRRRAYWCLKHYPGEQDMVQTRRKASAIWGKTSGQD